MRIASKLWSNAINIGGVLWIISFIIALLIFGNSKEHGKEKAMSFVIKSTIAYVALLFFRLIIGDFEDATGGFKPF